MADTPLRTLVTELRTRLERERQTDRALDRALDDLDGAQYSTVDDALGFLERALLPETLTAAEEENRRYLRESEREWARGRD